MNELEIKIYAQVTNALAKTLVTDYGFDPVDALSFLHKFLEHYRLARFQFADKGEMEKIRQLIQNDIQHFDNGTPKP